MLGFGGLKIVKMVFNSSNLKSSSAMFKNYKNIRRLLSADTVSKLDVNNLRVKVDVKKENAKGNNHNINLFLEEANKIGLDMSRFTDSLKNSVGFNIDHDKFLRNARALIGFGFSTDTVVKFIKGHQSLFFMENTKLLKSLELWHETGVSQEAIIELLSLHPQLIEIMGPTVMDRIALLLPYFIKMRNIITLFINSPRVIYENWGTLKSKLDFLHSYNIPMNKVANCNALDLSLLEMKIRFTFLERAGAYKKQTDLLKKDLTVKNATVRNILCTEDKLFAETLAKLTLVEYEAFTELYKMELDVLDEENYDDSDSE